MTNDKPGDLLLLRYGRGTQAARVVRVKRTGGLEIERFLPDRQVWQRGRLGADDSRILGPLPDNDPRRQAVGFKVLP